MDYTIKRGDTLGDIARRNHTTVKKLADDNHIADPNLILAGQTLHIDDPEAAKDQAATPIQAQSAPATIQTPAPAATTQTAAPAAQLQATSTADTLDGPPVTKPTQDTTQISQQAQDEIPVHQAVDLEEVARRAKAAQHAQQQQQPQAAQQAPQAQAPAQPEAPKPEAKPEQKSHKSWFDKLVDGGENLVKNTVGKIPVIGHLFNFQAQVTGGALKAVGDMVGGIFGAIAHPIRTLHGLWTLAEHIPFSPPNLLHVGFEALQGKSPSEILGEEGTYMKGLWNGLTAGYQDAIHEGKWGEIPGRLAVDVGSLLIGAGEVGGAAKGASVVGKLGETADVAKAADVAKVADVADAAKAADVADAAKAGEVADAGKAAEAADAAKAADAARASRLATAVDAFKGSAVGKATLDVSAGVQMMGEAASDFGKAVIKSIRESFGSLPASQIKEAEGLSTRAEELAKQFQEASKLEGPEAFKKMQELSKEASKIADETQKLGKADKGLRGLANGLRSRVSNTVDIFKANGVAGKAADIGWVATQSAKSVAEVGIEATKAALAGVGKLPKAVLDQLGGFGERVTALGARAKEAAGLTGEAAVNAYRDLAAQAKGYAAEARELAAKAGDTKLNEIADKLEAQAGNFEKVAGAASLGIPLNASRGGLDAVTAGN